MARSIFAMRRRTFLCVTLFVLVIAVALAFVSAQEDAAATAAGQEVADQQQQQQQQHEIVAEPAVDATTEAAEAAPHGEEAESAAPAATESDDNNEEAERAAQAAAEEAERQQQQAQAQEQQRQREEEEEAAARAAAAAAEAEARAAAEAEAQRQQQEAEEAARRAAEEAERIRQQEEEAEARRRQAEAEARQRREAEEQRRRAEAEAARRAAEERAKRELDSVDTIRGSAKELPEGCASLVEKYLFRVHEERKATAAAVGHVRAELNEARVNAPDTAAALEKKLAKAQDDLHVYDVQTLRTYGGNLPKTCIAEGEAWLDRQSEVVSENTYVQAYTHFYRLMTAHLVTMFRTAEGLVYYYQHSYTPSLQYFMNTAAAYQDEAWALYEKLFLPSGGRPEMPLADFAKQVAKMVGYASVPIGLGIAAGVVCVVALAPVAAGVVVYEFVYKIWTELFFFYYIYGMKLPEDLVRVASTTVENVKASQWNVIGNRAADAFFDSVIDSDKIFFNGIIAIFLLSHVVVIAAVLIFVWCRCCVPGMSRRKSQRSTSPSTSAKSGGKKAAKPAAAAAPAKKKASSPSPSASAEKKKN